MDTSTLALLVCGAVLWALWRARELRPFQVLIAAVFGFYLSNSGTAPTIRASVEAIFTWVSTWHI